MGLDMYLKVEFWGKDDIEVGLKKEPKWLKECEDRSVTIEVGYWRKANHIHKWFVDNVQNGVDECQTAYVSEEELMKLKSLCKQVIARPELAEKLLPTASGFFFGGIEYDEYYMQDVKHTLKVVSNVLGLKRKFSRYDIYYRSSW